MVDKLVFAGTGRHLTELELAIVQGAWESRTYGEIADIGLYSYAYIKNAAYQLWRLLSEALGQKVTKTNFRVTLERHSQSLPALQFPLAAVRGQAGVHLDLAQPRQDWGDAPDVSVFYGHMEELTTLQQWIVGDRCRLVALLGIGGIGKTALAAKLTQQIQDKFKCVIWRSLRHTPPVEDLLADLLQVLSNQQKTDLPDTLDGKISLLLQYLRRDRCLLVLDSAESILRSGSLAGHYREGGEGYEKLIRLVGEAPHQSCLLLLSREKLREIALLEGDTRPVRSLKMLGLGELDAREIVQEQGLSEPENWITLIQLYQGNPLALRIVSATIREIFKGRVSEFLEMNTLLVGSMLSDMLREHLHRLSDLETKIICCIASQEQPISLPELRDSLQPDAPISKIIQAVESLTWRSLIEQITETRKLRFTVQPVVREYVMTEYLKGREKKR